MDNAEHDISLLSELLAARQDGRPVALATVVKARGSVPRHAGSKMLVYADGELSGTIGGGEMESRVKSEALAALKDGNPRLVPYSLVDPQRGDPGVCGGEVEIYVEPYRSPASVLVIGCGHVGQAVAHLAGWLGFQVAVYDDRPELVAEALIPGADYYLSGTLEEALAVFNITDNTYVVAVTRNVLVDRQVLPKLLATPAPYIGVIGSRRRWAETKRLLLEDGLSDEAIVRFHSPIGLELNAETPKEIALSIMGEIMLFRYGGAAQRMAVAEGELSHAS
ncbi:MAG TPA: XdhC/CoxI family protein [Anaerolineae bacterium]|jgi:xanthine dehydrogenase accessory factor|nr:XdhC/CoxI family protein [Anaerolineae bacterium]